MIQPKKLLELISEFSKVAGHKLIFRRDSQQKHNLKPECVLPNILIRHLKDRIPHVSKLCNGGMILIEM